MGLAKQSSARDVRTPTARHSLELAQNHQGTREPHLSTFLAACSPQVLSGRGHARRQTAKRIPSPARSNAPKIHRSANGGGRSARRQPSIPMAAQSGQCVHWTTRLVPCPTQAGASRSASTTKLGRNSERSSRSCGTLHAHIDRGLRPGIKGSLALLRRMEASSVGSEGQLIDMPSILFLSPPG